MDYVCEGMKAPKDEVGDVVSFETRWVIQRRGDKGDWRDTNVYVSDTDASSFFSRLSAYEMAPLRIVRRKTIDTIWQD